MRSVRRVSVVLLVTVVLSQMTINLLGQDWVSTKTLQNNRARFPSVAAKGKVYFAGGYGSGAPQNSIDVYDTLTGTVTPLGLSLSPSRHSLSGVYNESANKIFFAGGQLSNGSMTSVIEVYNVTTGNWDAPLALPRGTGYMCAASYGSKILFAGGSGGGSYYKDLYVFDVSGGSPRTYKLSEARDQIAVAVVGSKVVMAGGHTGGNVYSDSVDIFDLETEQFIPHTLLLSEKRSFLGGAAVGDKVFFGGGQISSNTGSKVVDVFDLSGVTPTNAGQLQLSQARYYICATSVGSKVFFGGGNQGQTLYDVVDIFDINNGIPSPPETTKLSIKRTPISASRVGNKVLFAGGSTGPGSNDYTNIIDIYDTKIIRPTITTLVPADDAIDIPYSTDLQITFSERINKGSGNVIIKVDGVALPEIPISDSKISIIGNNQLKIDLDGLKFGGNITVELSADAVKDVDGNNFIGLDAPNVWNFKTEPLAEPQFSFPDTFEKGGSINVTMTVPDATKYASVKFVSRGISDDPADLNEEEVSPNNNVYSVTLNDSDFTDKIGLYYYFVYEDVAGTTSQTPGERTYIKFPTRELSHSIPNLKHGNTMDKYQIISIPMQLDDDDLLDVFSALGNIDNTKWRLYKYENDANIENPQDILTGRGYWLITRNSVEIRPGPGTTVKFSDEVNNIPFTVKLKNGYNLIGNPYDFAISWADVRAANATHQDLLSTTALRFDGTVLDDGLKIDPYRGAFVDYNGSGEIDLIIPVKKNNDIPDGRIAGDEVNLSSYNWLLKLELTDGTLSNAIGGIGMNKQATLIGKDRFDRLPIPIPGETGIFQISFAHPEIDKYFVREVVPSADSHIWDVNIDRTSDSPLTLKWDNTLIAETEKQLYLIDLSFGTIRDMKAESSYTIPSSTHNLKVLFGDEESIERTFDELLPYAGVPYPNPALDVVKVPFYVPSTAGSLNVNIEVINTQGARVATLADANFESGRHEALWNTSGKSGLYIVEMKIGNSRVRSKVVVK